MTLSHHTKGWRWRRRHPTANHHCQNRKPHLEGEWNNSNDDHHYDHHHHPRRCHRSTFSSPQSFSSPLTTIFFQRRHSSIFFSCYLNFVFKINGPMFHPEPSSDTHLHDRPAALFRRRRLHCRRGGGYRNTFPLMRFISQELLRRREGNSSHIFMDMRERERSNNTHEWFFTSDKVRD